MTFSAKQQEEVLKQVSEVSKAIDSNIKALNKDKPKSKSVGQALENIKKELQSYEQFLKKEFKNTRSTWIYSQSLKQVKTAMKEYQDKVEAAIAGK